MEFSTYNHPNESYLRIQRPQRAALYRYLKVTSILTITRMELAQELESTQHITKAISNSYSKIF